MASLETTNDRISSFDTRLALVKARKQGISLQSIQNAHTLDRLEALDNLAQRIVSNLGSKLEDSREQIVELRKRVVAELNSQTILQATQNHLGLLHELQLIQASLNDILPEMRQHLEFEKQDKEALTAILQELRSALKKSKSPHQPFFDHLAQSGNHYIATGKPLPIPKKQ